MDVTGKRGLRLTGKIAAVVAVPMMAVVIISCIVGMSGMNGVAEVLMKGQLSASVYSLEELMDSFAEGDYRYENGTLYKGEYNITENQSVLDEFKANTGMDVSIIIGDVRAATTMADAAGNSMKDQAISGETYAVLQNGNSVYSDSLKIGSQKYFVYYEPITASDGQICGSFFVGYNQQTVFREMRAGIVKMVVILCMIAVLALIVALLMIRSIGKMLEHTIGNLEEVADGSLAVQVQDKMINRQDELGELARSMQKLAQELTSIVRNILTTSRELDEFSDEFKESFQNITESIGNINTAVDEIAHGATQQAGDTQQANERVIHMGDAIDATAGNVIELTDSAKKMSEYNQSADRTLKELLEISKKTNQSVNEVQKQTDNTNRSAQEIQEATELIASIASQTNLLSLNASIEAARAGEQGKGFAVVATEIRTLADQCRESADKISNVVNELIGNSNQSVRTMNEVMEIIGEQNEKLENTLAMFGELNDEVGIVSRAIGQISQQVEGLGVTKNAVLELLESLSAIAEENAASTQETSASMVELSDIVQECTENTNGLIKLSDDLKENTTRFSIDTIKDELVK